jgi:hypothetical protein
MGKANALELGEDRLPLQLDVNLDEQPTVGR